jgi:hypothetical protein
MDAIAVLLWADDPFLRLRSSLPQNMLQRNNCVADLKVPRRLPLGVQRSNSGTVRDHVRGGLRFTRFAAGDPRRKIAVASLLFELIFFGGVFLQGIITDDHASHGTTSSTSGRRGAMHSDAHRLPPPAAPAIFTVEA